MTPEHSNMRNPDTPPKYPAIAFPWIQEKAIRINPMAFPTPSAPNNRHLGCKQVYRAVNNIIFSDAPKKYPPHTTHSDSTRGLSPRTTQMHFQKVAKAYGHEPNTTILRPLTGATRPCRIIPTLTFFSPYWPFRLRRFFNEEVLR